MYLYTFKARQSHVATCIPNVMHLLPRNFIKSNLGLNVCATGFNVAVGNLFLLFGFRDFVIALSNQIPASHSIFLLVSEFSPSQGGNGRKGVEIIKLCNWTLKGQSLEKMNQHIASMFVDDEFLVKKKKKVLYFKYS